MTKGASAVQVVPWDTINLLRPFFDKGPGPVAARLLDFPMLRGAWAGSVAYDQRWHDISGHGNHLTRGGDPQHGFDGLVPYWDFDGVGDNFSITDLVSGNDFDITGTESYVVPAQRGLTFGGWFKIGTFPGVAAFEYLMGKWAAGAEAYLLCLYDTDDAVFYVRNTALGTNINAQVSGLSADVWYNFVGRFVPSTSVSLFVNGEEEAQTTVNVPASLPNTTADFFVSASYDGLASSLFVSACAFSDTVIKTAYHMTKRSFGH